MTGRRRKKGILALPGRPHGGTAGAPVLSGTTEALPQSPNRDHLGTTNAELSRQCVVGSPMIQGGYLSTRIPGGSGNFLHPSLGSVPRSMGMVPQAGMVGMAGQALAFPAASGSDGPQTSFQGQGIQQSSPTWADEVEREEQKRATATAVASVERPYDPRPILTA